MQDTKKCAKCGYIKPVSDFNHCTPVKLHPYCKPCQSVAYKEWSAKNKKHKLDYMAKWHREHAVEVAAYDAQRYKNGGKERQAANRRKNSKRYMSYTQQYHRRLKLGGPKPSASEIKKLLEFQSHKCAACGAKLLEDFELDHIIPVAKGGQNCISNRQALCKPCNRKKSKMDMAEFIRRLEASKSAPSSEKIPNPPSTTNGHTHSTGNP